MEAVRDYQAATGNRMNLAWTMIRGVNTSVEDARQLADRAAGLRVRLDLIDVNDSTGEFLPPTAEELRAFRDALTAEVGMPIARRYSGGADVHGACGMLAGRVIAEAEGRKFGEDGK